jgi:hypothetical protein
MRDIHIYIYIYQDSFFLLLFFTRKCNSPERLFASRGFPAIIGHCWPLLPASARHRLFTFPRYTHSPLIFSAFSRHRIVVKRVNKEGGIRRRNRLKCPIFDRWRFDVYRTTLRKGETSRCRFPRMHFNAPFRNMHLIPLGFISRC